MPPRGRLNLSAQRLELLGDLLRGKGIERGKDQGITPRPGPAAPVPLTASQARMWFLDQLTADASAYVISAALRLRGSVDLSLFARACAEIASRHEALRTVFTERDGQPYQQVRDDLRPEVNIYDLSGHTAGAAEAEVTRRHAELAGRPFDLTTGPLLRLELLRLGPAEAAMLVSMHHIVSDQWSIGVFMRELISLYSSYAAGQPGGLPDLHVQYPDFAAWQRRTAIAGESAALRYWVDQLRDAPAEIGLATDRPRSTEMSYRGSAVPIELPAPLVAALRRLAGTENVTVFMVMASVFMVLLRRLSDTEDIVIGTPVANRPLAELEPLIGLFMNTLVLRTDLSGNPTFAELLGRARQVCLDAFDHQGVPFERVVDELRPERSLSRTPVFQVLFSYQNVPFPTWTDGKVQVEPIPTEFRTAKFDLTLGLFEDGDTISGRFEYSSDLFDAERVQRMTRYFLRLLRSLAADPGQRIDEVPLLDERERQEVLARSRGPMVGLPAVGGVHELVTAQTAATPDAIALVSGGAQIRYGELEERSNRLARYLRDAGAGPDSPVGLCLPSGADMVTAILAVWKTGAAYLPLDPGHPPDRVAFMLADSEVTLLVATAGWLAGLPLSDVRPIVLDDPEVTAAVAAASASAPTWPTPAEQLAYVIYTSGSTGTPKGVQVTQRGLVNYVTAMPGAAGLGEPGARYALLQPPVTDLGNTMLFTSLVTGGVLHILDPGAVTDPAAVAAYLAEHDIDYMKIVPSHLAGLAAGCPLARLIPAKTLLLGGEASSPRQISELLDLAGDRVVANHYGPTEATIGVATVRLAPGHLADGVVPIGSPIANTSLYVLDAQLSPVPPGVAGELFIGGAGLARGYVKRPELTAGRFIRDPFAGPEARMYRTGDRARWRSDGELEFLGRVDHQVKIRGYRIEPGEIEAVLGAHPAVARALVIAREDTPGTRQLVGYVIPAAGAATVAPDPGELRAWVGQTLPDYMVPAAIVVLKEFPLTGNGKVDRKRLPAPDFAAAVGSRAPQTADEELVCGIFAQVLGLPEVGAEDRFFDLGGDSIQVIQVVSRARAAGLAISTRDVFVHQTPTALAAAAPSAERPAAHDVGTGEIEPTPIMEWLRQLNAQVDQFSQTVVLPVPAPAKYDELASALSAVVDRHDALRARLVVRPDGRWSLAVGPTGSVAMAAVLRRLDVSGMDGARIRELLAEQSVLAPGRLDPAAGMMMQAVWFDAGPRAPGWLLLTIHHLVVDGVSWRILIPDLQAAWEAAAARRAINLSPVATSLRRWASLLTTEARTPGWAAELPVWQEVLRDAAPLVSGTHNPDGAAGRLTVTLSAADTAPLLAQVPANLRVGVQDVLLTAFGIALASWQHRTGTDGAMVVDVEGHGRDEELTSGIDLTRTVGWFTSHYPVRLDPGPAVGQQPTEPGTDLEAAVGRIIRQLQAIPGDGLGYGLLRYLNPDTGPELAALPHPQVSFNYLGRFASTGGQAPWEPFAPATDETNTVAGTLLTHPLSLSALAYEAEGGPRLVANWTWAAGPLAEEEVNALAQTWFTILRAITAYATRPGMDLPLPVSPPVSGAPRVTSRPDAITIADRRGDLPLSFAQLETVHKPVGPDSAHHNVISGTVLSGELDEVALRRGLDHIVQRHEALRTRYRQHDHEWTQRVDPAGSWPLRIVDLRAADRESRDQGLRKVIREEENRPFDLAGGSLVRATVVRMAPGESVLFLVLHHIVLDPWGYGVLGRELAELYQAHHTGRAPRLPELPVQYPDFAVWEQRQLASGAFDQHVAYWRELLKDLPSWRRFEAPSHQKTETLQGYTHGTTFDPAFTRALKDAARRSGLTPFMLLFSAYHALLASYAGTSDIAVCFPLAGRARPEAEHLIGNFINVVVVRTDQSHAATFLDLARQVRDGTLNAHAHQEVPLRILDGGFSADQDPFRVEFNLVNYADISLGLHGLHATPLTAGGEDRDEAVIPEVVTAMKPGNLDLYLVMHERDERLGALWLYSPERIGPRVMAAMMRQWPVLLDLVVRDPEIPLADLRRLLLQAPADSR